MLRRFCCHGLMRSLIVLGMEITYRTDLSGASRCADGWYNLLKSIKTSMKGERSRLEYTDTIWSPARLCILHFGTEKAPLYNNLAAHLFGAISRFALSHCSTWMHTFLNAWGWVSDDRIFIFSKLSLFIFKHWICHDLSNGCVYGFLSKTNRL